MIRRYCFLLAGFVAACFAMCAFADPTAEEKDNLAKLQALRKHPEQLARLRENVKAFLRETEQRQKAIVDLDANMQQLSPARQERYWKTLERYADWLDHLKKSDPPAYKAIAEAPDSATRLKLITERRDQEWMETRPKAQRQQWADLKGEAKGKYVADLRQDERDKHQRWVIAQRFWKEIADPKKEMPCRLSDFGVLVKDKKDTKPKLVNKVADYVNDYLLPFLTDEEKEKLNKAEGHWPDYPLTLVAIASKHPSALPPPRKEDFPTGPDKLPAPVKVKILESKKGGGAKGKKELNDFKGQPLYGEKAVEFGTNKGAQPFEFEFWPSSFKGLQAPMQTFVKEQLTPKLDTRDQADLDGLHGRWPYYPLKIQELAKKHNLDPPWHILPEANKWHWDRYRPARYQTPTAEKAKGKDDTD